MTRRKRYIILGAVSVAVVSAGAYGISAAINTGGVSAGVAALDSLPPVAEIPAEVETWLQSAADHTNTTPAVAESRVRLLRVDLGSRNRDAYAFRSATGAVCFYLTDDVGTCPNSADIGDSGLQWTIGGGDANSPANLFALTADDVTSIQLIVDGNAVPVSVSNNIAFAEFDSAGQQAVITVEHADGNTNDVSVRLADGPAALIEP